MKKLLLHPITLGIICVCALFYHGKVTQAQDGLVHAELRYPQQAKVGETIFVEVELTSVLPPDTEPHVAINTSTSPKEHFTLIPGYPVSAIRFKEPGDYAFSVSSGFMLKEA